MNELWISLALRLACRILNTCLLDDRCDGDHCREVLAEVKSTERKLELPQVGFGFADLFGFVKCLDVNRLVAWVKEGVDIFKDARCVEDGQEITLGEVADQEA